LTEVAASAVATAGMFAVALVSMTSVSLWTTLHVDPDGRLQTTVTFLAPARPPDVPRPATRRVPRTRPLAKSEVPAPTAAEPVAPQRMSPPLDTSTTAAAPPVRLTDITIPPPSNRIEFSPNRPRTGLGAPAAPAGLTDRSRIAGAAAATSAHDSAFAAWAKATHDSIRLNTMSDGAKRGIAESQREMTKLAQRVGTAGASADVHVVSGRGVDGVGAVGGNGVGSIGVPLLSRGKSREQRVRDSIIDADVRAGLARLAERIAAKRDSIRADSIRADSIRVDSARRLARSRKP